MRVEIVSTLTKLAWPICFHSDDVFTRPDFLRVFEEAKVVGSGTGWHPLYFLAIKNEQIVGMLPTYIKQDSFGEFIFDWAWADLYHRAGISYYPKIISAIPFSPVNIPKAMGKSPEIIEALMSAFSAFLEQNPELSSAHYLFANEQESKTLEDKGFFTRKTIQYHLELKAKNFEEYLDSLKARKRKQIRKERETVKKSGLEIKVHEHTFSEEFIHEVYQLYLNTIEKKWSRPYLNEDFFQLLAKQIPKVLVIVGAYDQKGLAAMSLFIKGSNALYGRYWGKRCDVEAPYLHFELSYYQGIEYCLAHGLALFEAGAQGEQKLLRGFSPVEILSCHRLSIVPLHEAIKKHVKTENAFNHEQILELEKHLPFKHKEHSWQDS